MRRRDQDGARFAEPAAELRPRLAGRARIERVHRRAVGDEYARQTSHQAACFRRPSVLSASCTLGRAPTRARYAVTLGHLERSNCSGLVQLSTVNAYASATPEVLPIR